MITTVGVTIEEALADIGSRAINVVINMECDGEAYWVRSQGEVCLTHSMYHWVYWITNPSYGDEFPNIDWLVAVFTGTKNNYGSP